MSFYVGARAAHKAGVSDDLHAYLVTEGFASAVTGIHVVSPTCFVLEIGLRDETGAFYVDPSNPLDQASAIRPVTPLFVMPDDLFARLEAIGEPSLIRAA